MGYQCPKCQSENIRKASEIYREGVQTGTMKTQNGSRTVTTVSAAAKDAAPPAEKNSGSRFVVAFGSFIGLMIFGQVAGLLTSHNDVIALGYFFLAVGGIIFMLVKGLAADRSYNNTVYLDLRAKWERMWKCNRCGEYFLDEDMDAA